MISMNAIGSAGGAATYYTQEQAAIEYYAGEAVPSQWHGKGAEINGLEGAVKAEDLAKILEGKVKEVTKDANGVEQTTEKQLGRTVTDEKTGESKNEHRAGWDLTFSAPKSVSIEIAVFGNKDLQAAHDRAVEVAMQWFEKEAAMTRINGKRVETGNLTYATFGHATSREGDPQVHTHGVVANVTYINGKAYSLSNERLMQMRTTGDAVYKNEMASGAQKIGFAVEYDGRGNFEIKGHDKAARDQFSKRSEQIKESLAERGHDIEGASYGARQAATLATRKDKGENHNESAEAHRDRWQAEAKEAGIEQVKRVDPKQLQSNITAAELVDSAIASVADREQVFAKKDLVKEVMLQSSGRVSSSDLLKEIERRAKSGDLVQREHDKAGARYTTNKAIAGELWADKQISNGREAHIHVMTVKEFDTALSKFEKSKGDGFKLNDEQRNAAKSILTGTDQFQAVQGAAGTGKTTMVEFIRGAAQSKGWTVQGMATGAAQAGKLQDDSGIQSTTTASFLRTKREEVGGTTKTLFVVDEASLAGQKEFNGIIGETKKSGARTVFLGDVSQHQSVAAGAALERAIGSLDEPKMQVDFLKNITRQKVDETGTKGWNAKEAVSLIMAGDHAAALKKTALEYKAERVATEAKWGALMEKQGGKLTTRQTEQKRDELKAARLKDNEAVISAIAKDYGSLSKEAQAETLVITATNKDRSAINEGVRSELKAQGELKGGVKIEVLTKRDVTDAQKLQVSTYQRGDVLTKEDKKGQVQQFKVLGNDTAKNILFVTDAKGQKQSFNGDQLGLLSAWAADTKEFAAGDKVAFMQNSKSAGVKNGWGGTVEKVNGDTMTVKLYQGGTKDVDLKTYKQLDHGYATTSHKSQGQTVKNAWVHHNTEGGMHSQREAYVNMTRAREKTTTYTQDSEKASKQASQEQNKTMATKPRRKPEAQQEATKQQEQAPQLETTTAKQKNDHVQSGGKRDFYEPLEAKPAIDQQQGQEKARAAVRGLTEANTAVIRDGATSTPNTAVIRDQPQGGQAVTQGQEKTNSPVVREKAQSTDMGMSR
jgi:conjugative relaxase-like TrwC/TraI family protein